jgi:acyl carrier protein
MVDRGDVAARLMAALDADETVLGRHFLDAGGDSLVAIRLMEEFSSVYGIDVGPDVLFGSDTLAEVAHRVAEMSG